MPYPFVAGDPLPAADLNTAFAARATLTGSETLTNKTISAATLTGTTTLPSSGQINSSGWFAVGGTATAQFEMRGNASAAVWGGNGIGLRGRANTYTDTSSSGTVATVTIHALSGGTIAASSVTTFTLASTLRLTAAPVAGSNVTITNGYALSVVAGGTRVVGGVTLIGVTYANRPATPEAGAHIYITDSNTATWRATIAGGGANKVVGWYDGTNWLVSG